MTLNPDSFPEDSAAFRKEKSYAESIAETALALSRNDSSQSLQLMFNIQDELERRVAMMSVHSQDFRSHSDALEVVTLLIEQKLGPDIDKLLDSSASDT
jgi:hypothetical protein